MKNRGILLPSGKIRTKMLIWLLGVTAIMVLLIAFVVIQSTYDQGRITHEIGTVADLQTRLDQSNRSLVYYKIIPMTIALLLIIVIIGWIHIRRVIEPIQKLTVASQNIAAGDWEVEIPLVGEDEVGVLAKSFESMTLHLHSIVTDLENHVNERTEDLNRRTAQLEVASQIARQASAIRNVDLLLNRATNLISEKFGFYHVGIFLIDESNEYVILRASNSIGGKQMLSHGHKLKVGEIGIVGFVAGMGRSRIAVDVGEDAIYLKNPNLPDTRSEMAVPLKIHEQIIGVLDVQSTEPSAFSDEDIQIIQVLGDQIALAVDNARLFDKGQTAMFALKQIQGEQTIGAWKQRLGNCPVVYFYDRSGIVVDSPGEQITEVPGEAVITSNEKYHLLIVPIVVREQTLGVITLRRDIIEKAWTNEELALVVQTISEIVPALENARLLEDAQTRAEHEKRLNLITSHVRGSASLDTILQNTVRELGKALGVSRTFIHFGIPENPDDRE
jgi:GAF domain-containing protein/HAMP domain-containing protein